MSEKPKVFISSTIFDFFDLRSAIKYYLESLGYEVYLSEYNDFYKDFDKNSYDECLNTIEKSDYFILLIGSRVGGYYDKINKISITQQEYRKAYDQLLNGKLKMINIIRENLWLARNERKQLEKIIKSEYQNHYDISDKDVKKIVSFRSDIVNNAEFTFNFINEVIKTEEMKGAQSGNNEFPKGNWIHTFKTFNDIVDILKKVFKFSSNLEELALVENLKYELVQNLKNLFFKNKKNGNIYQKNIYCNTVAKNYSGKIDGISVFNKEEFGLFPLFIVSGIGTSGELKTEFIDNCLKTGKFLKYNFEINNFEQSPMTNALLRLKGYIEDLKNMEKMEEFKSINRIKLYDSFNIHSEKFEIQNILLYSILLINNLQNKIISLSYVIYMELFGIYGLLEKYDYENTIPSKEISDELEEEKITNKDIINYLTNFLKEEKERRKI